MYPSEEHLHNVASSRCGLGHRNFAFSPVSYTDTVSAIRVHLIISFPNPTCVSAVTLNSSTTSYRLTGLKEKTSYRVQISGFTNAGEGPPTLSQPFSTPKYGTVEALCICVTQHQSLFYALYMALFSTLSCFSKSNKVLMHKIYYSILSN